MPDLSTIFPHNIKKIAVVSPASPPKRKLILEFADKFQKLTGIKVELSKNIFAEKDGKLPAPEKLRLKDINDAIEDESIDLILCSRGGYGSAGLLNNIEWSALRKRNLPILGYSDITAVHLAMLTKKAGVPISSPMADKFFECVKHRIVLDSLAKALNYDKPPLTHLRFPKARIIKKGTAQGEAIPVNLTIFTSLIGAEFMPDMEGKILILEDIAEEEYKIDRMMTQVGHAGILSRLSGLAFGNFTRCGSPAALNKIFAKFAKLVNGPVVSGIQFGHVQRRLCLRFGQNIEITPEGGLII